MKNILLFIGLLAYSGFIYPQTVMVVDKSTLQPISGAKIKCNDLEVKTDIKGKADISSLTGCQEFLVESSLYESQKVLVSSLESMQYTIMLIDKLNELDVVIVSSSKFEEKRKDVAQQVQVISNKDLQFMNQSNMADVMTQSGNVLVQKSQFGGGSPIIRGFEANKVLMVVDGVRMNNAIYRGGHLQNILSIDNSMLDRTEIVFGPGSVVYGSDALGGVMHFFTKKPLLNDENNKRNFKANVFTRTGTAANELTGHVDFNYGFKKIAFLTSVTASSFDDLRQGNIRNPFYGDWGKSLYYAERINGMDSMMVNEDVNIQKRSGYMQYDVMEKILIRQSDNINHILNFQFSNTGNINRYDRLTEMSGGKLKFAEWYYGPQKRIFGSYQLNLENGTGFYTNGRITLAYQDIEESRHDRRFNNNNINHRYEQVNVLSINADFDKKVKEHELRYGIEALYNKVNSTAEKENIVTGETGAQSTRYPDGGSVMQSYAAYFTHTWEISEHLVLNDGIRYTNYSLACKFIDTSFFPFPFEEANQKAGALNGSLGLVIMPGKDFRISVLGSTGFRAPNVDDMAKVFESNNGSLIIPNPDLKPEQTYNAETGISKLFYNRVNLSTTAFYTLYKNALTVEPTTFNGEDSISYAGSLSAVSTTVNEREAYIYGLNISMQANITDEFSITSSVNYTHGRIKTDSTEYPLDHVPPVFGKTGLNLKMKKFRGEFFVIYNGAKVSKNYNLLGEDNQVYSADPINGYTPAWFTLNVRTAYQFNQYLQVQVGLENILDQNYRVFASGVSAPGRNLTLTLRGNF